MSTVNNPFPYFPDAGTNGYIYIGEANQDAQTNPITVYRDEALTIPWAQPIRTLNGYPAYQGAQGEIYTAASSWSITVKDKQERVVSRSSLSYGFATWADLASTNAGLGDDLIGAHIQWETLQVAPYLKTVSDIRNQKPVSILSCVPEANVAAVKAGTSSYDVGATLNELLVEMKAAGGGSVEFWPGGRIATSTTIIVRQGCQLLNQGRYSVGNRDNLKPYGLFRIDGVGTTDAVMKVERTCSGTLVRGIWIDGANAAGGDCFAVEGSGTTSPDRWNGQAEGLMLTNAPQHGFKIRMGVGGYHFANIYSYNPAGDCYNFADGCEDLQGNFFFGSNADGFGLYNQSASARFYQYDVWASNVGIYDEGTNSRHHFFQTDLNAEQGIYIGSGATRQQWIGGTTLSNSMGTAGALPEVTINGNVRGVNFSDTVFGTKLATLYPRRAVEFLGTSNKGVVFSNCMAEPNAFATGEIFNGQARRWCRIENFTGFADIVGTTPGQRFDFPDVGQNLISNPDLQNGAADWTNSTPVTIADENNTTIGQCVVITPTTTDSDQFIDYQVLPAAELYRGRRIAVSLIYQSPSGNTQTKSVGVRIGVNAVQTYNITNHDGEYHNLVSQAYRIGSGDSGALVIRIRVKIAGQGAHQEILRINDVKLRLQ